MATESQQDGDKVPHDVPASPVQQDAKQGRGECGYDVDEAVDGVRAARGQVVLAPEEQLPEADEGEDGAVVGDADDRGQPEGGREVEYVAQADHLASSSLRFSRQLPASRGIKISFNFNTTRPFSKSNKDGKNYHQNLNRTAVQFE